MIVMVRLAPMTKRQLIRHVLRSYWPAIIIALIAMAVEAGAGLLEPWPLKFIIDSVLGDHPLDPWLATPTQAVFGTGKMAILAFAVSAAVIIAVLAAVSTYIDSYLTKSLGIWFTRDLRRMIFHKLQNLSVSYYEKQSTGTLISTMTTDVNAIQAFVSTALLGIIVDVLMLFGMIAIMLHLDWEFTLVALVVMPLMVVYISRLMAAVKRATKLVRQEQSNLVSIEQETATAMPLIQAFGRDKFAEDRFETQNIAVTSASVKSRRFKALVTPSTNLILALGMAMVMYFGARHVLAGKGTIGDLVVFLAYLAKMFKPIQDMSKMGNVIAQAWVGMERIQAILSTQSAIQDKPDAIKAPPFDGRIDFRNVEFAYKEDQTVLHDIDLAIGAGQRIALVGPSGHGKSTIIDLITRLYDPVSGAVEIDGRDIREFTVASLRDQLSVVLQEAFLFHDSILENIRFGRLNATAQEVADAAKAAGAHDFICSLPDGYDTVLAERGATLSGGERQRIGIARAILRDTPIWLLDEPTASLDASTETKLMENLRNLVNGKTCIVVAHRLATIRDADLIVVIKHGTIAERGTHSELMRADGEYASLYRMQE
jgi:subfamily B ATP-binding cassette protein MsbA